jgi:hypothetical protein
MIVEARNIDLTERSSVRIAALSADRDFCAATSLRIKRSGASVEIIIPLDKAQLVVDGLTQMIALARSSHD